MKRDRAGDGASVVTPLTSANAGVANGSLRREPSSEQIWEAGLDLVEAVATARDRRRAAFVARQRIHELSGSDARRLLAWLVVSFVWVLPDRRGMVEAWAGSMRRKLGEDLDE